MFLNVFLSIGICETPVGVGSMERQRQMAVEKKIYVEGTGLFSLSGDIFVGKREDTTLGLPHLSREGQILATCLKRGQGE